MSDPVLAVVWAGVLACGLAGCVVLKRLGAPTTYVRDLLHVGAGVWVLGWPAWHGWVMPVAIASAALAGVALVPLAARRFAIASKLEGSVAGGDEKWEGIILYTGAFLVMTAVALTAPKYAFAAAAALWALTFGDGIGGFVGRRFGRVKFKVGGGKEKSVEGSAAVFAAATLGVLLARFWFGAEVSWAVAPVLGLVAAAAEAVAPRSSDNVLIPAAVAVGAALLG